MVFPLIHVCMLITFTMVIITEIRGQNFVPPKDVCKGKILCDTVPNYPNRQVTEAVKAGKDKLEDFFGTEPLQDGIMARFGQDDEMSLCASRVETTFPKVGQTSSGDERYIVNNDEYKQGLSVEVCVNPGEACQFANSFPNGYQATCTQKYALRRMVGLDEKGESLVDYFRIPSCCVCSLKLNKV